ncbi:MAG: PAS domain S-box protein [Persicimonas sp.]
MFTSSQWKHLVEALPDPVLVVDASGRIAYASFATQQLFGYNEGELTGELIEILVPERYRSKHRADRAEYMKDPLTRTMGDRSVLWGRRKDGTEFPAHINFSPVDFDGETYAIAAVRDITELEDTRDQLSKAQRRLCRLIDHIPDAVTVHRNGRLIYVNPALAASLNYDDADELIGRRVLDLAHKEDAEKVSERVERMRETGEPLPPAELRFYRRDGSLLTAEIHSQPVVFDGKPAIVSIGRDISDKQALLARAMRLDRKIAVGTLASGVAHEVNNPLAFASSSVDFVKQQLDRLRSGEKSAFDAPELDDMLEALCDIRAGLDRIARIVSDLDTFVAPDRQRITPISVVAALETAINLVFARLDTEAHLVRSLKDVPSVEANQAQLAEVFVNLLINAVLAVAESDGELHEIRVSTSCVDARVYIRIEDTGDGISSENLPHIFDPFFSTRDTGEGTGLGLTIAQNVIQSFDGSIDIESEEGQGTTVIVSFPASDPCVPALSTNLDADTETMSF